MRTVLLLLVISLVAKTSAWGQTEVQITGRGAIKNATVKKVLPDGLLFICSEGLVKARFADLPAEYLGRYGQAAREEAKRVTAENIRRAQQPKPAQAVKLSAPTVVTLSAAQLDPETPEQRKQTEIRRAITDHRLMIGMTAAQAREAFGGPTSTTIWTDAGGESGYWIYPNRGRTANGQVCSRQVFLNGGIVTGWVDN